MTSDIAVVLRPIKVIFDSLSIRYFVGGSVASSYHGAMRSTMDVDIVAEILPAQANQILALAKDEFYASKSAI